MDQSKMIYLSLLAFSSMRRAKERLSSLSFQRLFFFIGSVLCFSESSEAQSGKFNFATGNAALEIVQSQLVSAATKDFSPTNSDPSLLLRLFTVNANGWYDAVAPYSPTAVGVYSHIGRRPVSESRDNTQMNIAILYASHKTLSHLLPWRSIQWDLMLLDVGLDPDNSTEDLTTAIGIGNAAGKAVVEGRAHDGMNALGDAGGRKFAMMPYSDYTGYKPVNTAYELLDPSKWQPQMTRVGQGRYEIQQFVTPQYQFVEPYSFKDPKIFSTPEPINSDVKKIVLYTAQAQHVLDESAALDDRKKMLAEFFNDKVRSLGGSGFVSAKRAKLGLLDWVIANFFTNVATFDAGIVTWKDKAKYDAVRPVTAIHYIFKGKAVRAYLGRSERKAGTLVADEWDSYLPVADHPEYPSGSACLCAAHAQFKRKYFGSDRLDWTLTFGAGRSIIEPGNTPKEAVQVTFETWTDFEKICGQSRVWGGVHFQSAVDESLKLCPVFGDLAYDYMKSLVSGSLAVRGPSRSTMN